MIITDKITRINAAIASWQSGAINTDAFLRIMQSLKEALK